MTFCPVSVAKVSGLMMELASGMRHDHPDLHVALHEQASDLSGFVCRDPAANTENDVHSRTLQRDFLNRRHNFRHHEVVLHEPAPHFLGRDHGRLLR